MATRGPAGAVAFLLEVSLPYLIVIYGPPLSGKTSLAREIAGALDTKTALVSTDAMLEEAIRVHDADAYAELEVVHTQARLLVANFLKNRYNVVLEGAFYYERDGVLHRHEQEIDQTLALMRNLADAQLVVRLDASPATLQGRAGLAVPPRDPDPILRIAAAYRPRSGDRSLHLSTDASPVGDLAMQMREQLGLE